MVMATMRKSFAGDCGVIQQLRGNRLAQEFVASWIVRNPLAAELAEALLEDVRGIPPTIAAAILFDQTVQDYRPVPACVTVPTLLCFGEGGSMTPAAAEYLRQHHPDARLELFAESNHSPHLEEADRFNAVVDGFLRALG